MTDTILTHEQRKARKQYKCHLCCENILKGNQYIYETYSYDGHIHTCHRHIHCDAMMDAWLSQYCQDECTFDEIYYGIVEDVCQRICTYEETLECDYDNPYACEKCQRKLLDPSILGAAMQSVRDNTETII